MRDGAVQCSPVQSSSQLGHVRGNVNAKLPAQLRASSVQTALRPSRLGVAVRSPCRARHASIHLPLQTMPPIIIQQSIIQPASSDTPPVIGLPKLFSHPQPSHPSPSPIRSVPRVCSQLQSGIQPSSLDRVIYMMCQVWSGSRHGARRCAAVGGVLCVTFCGREDEGRTQAGN